MRVAVFCEHRFTVAPDGSVWTSGAFAHSFWQRYLAVFDEVLIAARASRIASRPEGALRVDGDKVHLAKIPFYVGPSEFARSAGSVCRAIIDSIASADAVILRSPGILSTIAYWVLRFKRHPYGVELVGDPHDVFAPGAVDHPLRSLLRWGLTRATQKQAREARGVAYVTAHALQERYPCGEFQTAISSVELPEEALVTRAEIPGIRSQPFTFVTVGSLAQPYKGVDVLIDAIAICRESGHDVELKVVGDGRYRPSLEAQAERQSVAEHVDFVGQLPAGEAVREVLDEADAFVMASRTEGLPRAMIEAMARALPCLGTRVGGIPELLPDDYLVLPDDAGALAAKIQALASADEAVLSEASARNLGVAKRYRLDILNERRKAFYQHLREATAAWQREHQ